MDTNLPIVDRFIAYLADERHFSPYTGRCYGLDLRQFTDHIATEAGIELSMAAEKSALESRKADAKGATVTARILSCDVETIRGFLARLAEQNYSTATMARKIATLRSFHKWMERAGITSSNPMTPIRPPKQPKRCITASITHENSSPARMQLTLDKQLFTLLRLFYHRVYDCRTGKTRQRKGELTGCIASQFSWFLQPDSDGRNSRKTQNCRRRFAKLIHRGACNGESYAALTPIPTGSAPNRGLKKHLQPTALFNL